jgi:hypothetical protein
MSILDPLPADEQPLCKKAIILAGSSVTEEEKEIHTEKTETVPSPLGTETSEPISLPRDYREETTELIDRPFSLASPFREGGKRKEKRRRYPFEIPSQERKQILANPNFCNEMRNILTVVEKAEITQLLKDLRSREFELGVLSDQMAQQRMELQDIMHTHKTRKEEIQDEHLVHFILKDTFSQKVEPASQISSEDKETTDDGLQNKLHLLRLDVPEREKQSIPQAQIMVNEDVKRTVVVLSKLINIIVGIPSHTWQEDLAKHQFFYANTAPLLFYLRRHDPILCEYLTSVGKEVAKWESLEVASYISHLIHGIIRVSHWPSSYHYPSVIAPLLEEWVKLWAEIE